MKPANLDDSHGPYCRSHAAGADDEVVFCAHLLGHRCEHDYLRGGFTAADADAVDTAAATAPGYSPQAMLAKAAAIAAQIRAEDGMSDEPEPDHKRLVVRALQMSAHAAQLQALMAFAARPPYAGVQTAAHKRVMSAADHAIYRAACRVIADLNDELGDDESPK